MPNVCRQSYYLLWWNYRLQARMISVSAVWTWPVSELAVPGDTFSEPKFNINTWETSLFCNNHIVPHFICITCQNKPDLLQPFNMETDYILTYMYVTDWLKHWASELLSIAQWIGGLLALFHVLCSCCTGESHLNKSDYLWCWAYLGHVSHKLAENPGNEWQRILQTKRGILWAHKWRKLKLV